MNDSPDTKLIDNLKAADPLQWAYYSNLQIRPNDPFSLVGTPYLADLVKTRRYLCVKKGSQVRVSTTKFIHMIHDCLYGRYRQNVMYMMPTVKQVEALSKISLDPIIDNNLWLAKKFTVNTAAVKTINGRSIYFVGAQPQKVGQSSTKDSANLRSIPCDAVNRDELDLMDEDMVELSKQRLRDSDLKEETDFGSPTVPEYGIDYLYGKSTQGKWQIKCRSCGKYTCLVDHFPKSIIMVDGRWIRSCIHCHAEVFVADGDWQEDYPERDKVGRWVDGLLSPKIDLKTDMERFLESDGTARCEFMRSVLGIATVEAKCQLSDTDVEDRIRKDLMRFTSAGETVLGADINKTINYVVGIKTGDDAYAVLQAGEAEDFIQLHDIANKMNVRLAVLDAQPDIHAARDFQKNEPYTVYRCYYSEQMPGPPRYNAKEGSVHLNRNEWCDKVYDVFSARKISIPSQMPQDFVRHITAPMKTVLPNPETGIQRPRWVKPQSKPDHYFHAILYFLLAASRTSPRRLDSGPRVRFQTCKNACYI